MFSNFGTGRLWLVSVVIVMVAPSLALAQTATWNSAGPDDSWFTPGNWTPAAVPGTTTDAIINDGSTVNIDVDGAQAQSVSITGLSFVNFNNAATAAGLPAIAITGTGDAGFGVINTQLIFNDSSSAANATITLVGSGLTVFDDGIVRFNDTSTAGSSILSVSNQAQIAFGGASTAGDATITAGIGGLVIFGDTADAGTAQITNQSGGVTAFGASADAATATIINNAGGTLDISLASTLLGGSGQVNVGSLSGAGNVFLGGANLIAGGLNQDNTISGVIADGMSPAITAYLAQGGGPLPPLTGGSLTKVGTGTLTLTGTNTYTGGTSILEGVIAIASDANLGAASGPLTLDDGTLQLNASLNLASTRAITLGPGGGTVDTNGFNSTISQGMTGVGAFIKVGDGTLTLSGANTHLGGTAVFGGTLRAGAVNTFNPASGNIATGPAGTIDLAGFDQTVPGVFNQGLIQTGGTGSTDLTVTGTYLGLGGTLALNTFLGADGSPSDRLVLDGATATATGSSLLSIANIGGLGAQTVGPGILVVDTIGGATTAPGAFALAGPVVAGPYEYMLFRGNGNPDAWYLRSTLECSLDPTNPVCAGAPPGATAPNYRREVSLYAALPSMTLQYGRAILDTLHERVGQQGPVGSFSEGASNGAWGRVIGMHGKQDGDRIGIYGDGPEYDYDFWAFQGGNDFYRSTSDAGARNRAGGFFAIGTAHGDVTHVGGLDAGDDTFQGYSIGGYWTHYTPQDAYLDAVIMGTWYDAKGESTRFPALKTDGFGFASSLEGGYPFRFAGGFIAEPQAQLIYQTVNLDNAHDIGAFVHFDDVDALTGRVGIRFVQSWATTQTGISGYGLYDKGRLTAWFRPNIWYEFLGDPKTKISSEDGFVPFSSQIDGTTLELNAGLTLDVAANTAIYANTSYDIGLDGDSHAYDGKLGLKVSW
jgi:outer membrane autotransporter protein